LRRIESSSLPDHPRSNLRIVREVHVTLLRLAHVQRPSFV
jgi:hypothetical protein